MNTNIHRILGLAATACLATGVAACGDKEAENAAPAAKTSDGKKLSGKLAGAGASSQDAAQQAWIAGFQTANEGVTISYDPVGSGGGREQFNAGGIAYGGTDSAFSDDEGELSAAQKRCGGKDNFVEVPVYISPIAVIYNVDGVEKLQLSSDLIAKVFHGDITKWDDPAIAKENPDAKLPERAHHGRPPLGRLGHDEELHRLHEPDGSGHLDGRAGGRVAGQGPGGRRGHLRRRGRRPERQEHHRLRRRQPGR